MTGSSTTRTTYPEWFLAKLARERVAAARVALEQLGRDARSHVARQFNGEFHPGGQWDGAAAREAGQFVELHAALRTIEQFIRQVNTLEPECALVVAGLLGAQEVETERERREFEDESPDMKRRAELSKEKFLIDMARKQLDRRGVLTWGDLTVVQADEVEQLRRKHETERLAMDRGKDERARIRAEHSPQE